jgi:TPP-dependent pyruvate/acetoin dehydrogenase alpha subunit
MERPTTNTPISDIQAVSMLETMMLSRASEEALVALQVAGKAAGTCTAIGQEASSAGVISALAPQDRILTNHRSAGHLLARGAEPGRLFAEVLGRSGGYCKGKSGTLHISVKELGVILTSTIVGGELSLATGVALSQSMVGRDDGIVVCFFGDGAACEGIFHESLNLATVWNLPILYVCENNQWQAWVKRRETMPMDHVSTWAAAHGMPAHTVDGNDVETVYRAAAQGAEYVRSTRKPYFLETYTYRMRGHYEPDDMAYVPKAELEDWRQRDPIALARETLLKRGAIDEQRLAEMQARVNSRVASGLAFAESSPPPDLTELTTDVYA